MNPRPPPKFRRVRIRKVHETIEEIRFYVGHGMPEQAMAALAKLQTLTPDEAKIAELRLEIEASAQPAEEEVAVVEPVMEELTAEDVPSIEVVDETPVAAKKNPLRSSQSPQWKKSGRRRNCGRTRT